MIAWKMPIGVVLVVGVLSASQQPVPPQPCDQGNWLPPYNWGHDQNGSGFWWEYVMQAGLIPRGTHRGKVVFFGSGGWPNAPLDWRILDLGHDNLVDPIFNTPPQVPGPAGELACGAATWTEEGRWVVAGGSVIGSPNVGGDLIFTYDPDDGTTWGTWHREAGNSQTLFRRRYYPSVVLAQNGDVLIAGGSPQWNQNSLWDTYEVFRPATTTGGAYAPGTLVSVGSSSNREFNGPHMTGDPNGKFSWYPRIHFLTSGEMFMAGTRILSSAATHTTSTTNILWDSVGGYTNYPLQRGYGSSVLFPPIDANHTDTLMILGGTDYQGTATDSVEFCKATLRASEGHWPAGGLWTDKSQGGPPPLAHARVDCNATILPDASILVTGGHAGAYYTPPSPCNTQGQNWVTATELFKGGAWTAMAPQTANGTPTGTPTIRDHHAVAVLLPSGRVLSAMGNCRNYDFQVFEPPYVCQQRPQWIASSLPSDTIPVQVGTTTPIDTPWYTLPAGTAVGSVVLIRPASLTHHSDLDQRYVKLTTVPPDDPPPAPYQAIRFLPPASTNLAPKGYSMLFVVTTTGVPSVARWVKLE